MKYMKRTKVYKASNVTFDPQTLNAYSYGWWRFVARVDGAIVFNNYSYSKSTSKHQYKVYRLLNQLGIAIHYSMPCPKGINDQSLLELINEAEINVCDKWLKGKLKAQERYASAKRKALAAKLTAYLETQVHFRDYDIVDRELFADPGSTIACKVAVHQCVDASTLESDVNNALHSFSRDGFGSVVFYV